MGLLRRILLVLLMGSGAAIVQAQQDQVKPVKVAVFAPVYLDSAFVGDAYKLGNKAIPKYMLSGLDFYNGVMMAIDSLNAENAPVEVLVYDSKSPDAIARVLTDDPELEGLSLIIASFNTRTEIKAVADLAKDHHVPLISSTYPSDGGITDNPYFVMLNPTLMAHIDGIFKFLQRNYPTDQVILYRRKGNLEDMIQKALLNMNRTTQGTQVKFRTIMLQDTTGVAPILRGLDSTKQNIILCGSLDESFGRYVTRIVGNLHNYQSVVIGMPTWDGSNDIGKTAEIIYSTPYSLTRSDQLSKSLSAKYLALYGVRPSDMFYKGYESMYHFTKLALKHGSTLIDHLSDRDYKQFADFDIQAVHSAKDSLRTEYLENRKLYFIRKSSGKIKSVTGN